MQEIKLVPLVQSDREQFIRDNQEAFNFGALKEFGRRSERFEEEGEIISRETIEKAIDSGEAIKAQPAMEAGMEDTPDSRTCVRKGNQ